MSTRPALPSLVTSSQLHEALRHRPEEVRVLDATTFLHTTVEGAPYTASAGRDGYLAEHVPGAVFADVAGALSDPEAEQLFTVPSAEAFAQAAHDLGVGPTTHVVVYDTVGSAWATRVWWLFRLFGHDAVSVLDGGARGVEGGGASCRERHGGRRRAGGRVDPGVRRRAQAPPPGHEGRGRRGAPRCDV